MIKVDVTKLSDAEVRLLVGELWDSVDVLREQCLALSGLLEKHEKYLETQKDYK
jgi:hypothetical protein